MRSMQERRLVRILLAAGCVALSGTVLAPQNAVVVTKDQKETIAKAHTSGCDESLWTHVYHGVFRTGKNGRLQEIDACVKLTGTIDSVVPGEGDGDDHIRLKLDKEFADLLDDKNMTTDEKGHLVVEPMCVEEPKAGASAAAERVCNGFSQHIYDEKTMLHKHVEIVGAYVQDVESGHGWREIHPVTNISVIP